jgi:foldase protein PrsA
VLVIKRVIVAVFVLVLAAVAVSVAGCGGGVPGDAVAKVGNVLIKESDRDAQAKEIAALFSVADEQTDPVLWKQFEAEVTEYLIEYEVAAQKAEGLGVAVTDADVQTAIDTIVSSSFGGDQAAFTDALATSGVTLDGLKNYTKKDMLVRKVYEKVTETITEVPAEEIAAYYEENKASYFVDETRQARHILIKPGTEATNDTTTTTAAASTTTTTGLTDADWAKALATANEVRALLVAGGDWTELATKYSDDAGTAASGGDLGVIARGDMVPEFNDALFSLALNAISQPVKTSFGYHIIQVTAINEAKQSTLEEVSDTIKADLLAKKKNEAYKKWLADTKTELGVTYREDLQPTTTVIESTTTTVAESTITTGATTTTVKP